MRTFATARTFCASHDGPCKGGARLDRGNFARFRSTREKQILTRVCEIRRKLGVTMHFSEIIKLQSKK